MPTKLNNFESVSINSQPNKSATFVTDRRLTRRGKTDEGNILTFFVGKYHFLKVDGLE